MYKVIGRPGLKKLLKRKSGKNKTALPAKLLFALLAAVMTRVSILDSLSPFGVAILAAAPEKFSLAGFIGASAGYFFISPVREPLEYISMCVAAVGIRWALCELKGIYKSRLFMPCNAAVSVILTGVLLTATGGGAGAGEYGLIFAEGLIAAAGAYFFDRTLKALKNRAVFADDGNLTACYISAVILLLCFSWMKIGGFSLYRVLLILTVILAASARGAGAGASAGIICAVALALAGDDTAYISLAYAAGGLAAGAAAKKGKTVLCSSFLLAALCGALAFSGTNYIALFAGECAAAAAIFLGLPKRAENLFKPSALPVGLEVKDDFMRRMITARLRVSARAFSDIGEIFELVSEKSNRFPGSSAKPSSKAGACASCPKRAICGALPSYQKAIKQARALDFESKDFSEKLLPDFFLENCQKPDALAVSLLREHMGSAAEKTVKKRAADMQTAISGQFIAISRLFDDMTGELVNFGVYKPAEAEKIEKELQADGITPQNVICRRMRGEKLAVEADGYSRFDEKKTKKIIDSAVKNVMGSGLSAPLFSYDKGRFLYRGGQRERFEISCGVAQHSKNNSRFCGDSYNFFYDGKGGAVFILSDGMGTGGSAAVDSAAVCGLFSRMVIAGAGFKSALLMVNSTLLARPDEESAATVDACFVNLYTGKANFIKAGAPYTYIKYEDGNEFLNMESLPVGILEGVSYAQKELDLSGGATIIMMSDGAAENLSEFSGNAADKYELLSAQDMAERLLQKCLLAQGGQEDDLTVAVLKLKRSAEEDTKSDKKTA